MEASLAEGRRGEAREGREREDIGEAGREGVGVGNKSYG